MVSENLNEQKKYAGGDVTSVFHNTIGKVEVDASSISSFACTFNATLFLYAKKPDPQSMIPDNAEATGLFHFYQEDHPEKMIEGKKAKVWKFITEAEYEERKDSLPDVCFATRHYIEGLAKVAKQVHENSATDSDWVYNGLPDLGQSGIQFDDAAQEHK